MKLLVLLSLFCLWQAALSKKIINCYWDTWAYYRPGDGKFDTSHIDPKLCTHLTYSFFGISDRSEFKSLDTKLDMDDGFIKKSIDLKSQNPSLKVLAVVGGWKEGSTKYTDMAADPVKRATFTSTARSFIQKHRFDGLILDWEHPSAADKSNIVNLLREIKASFDQHGLELSVAVNVSAAYGDVSYDIPAISRYVNYINLMTFDFHTPKDGKLGHNSPIPEVQKAIDYWIQKGAPANKLVLGVAAFGHTYQMADSSKSNSGDKSIDAGKAGPFTLENGYLGYNEICVNKWVSHFDVKNGVPYAKQDNQWVGFDNDHSIQLKMDLVNSRNLAGAMMWSLDTDDFRGRCGKSYPLLIAINLALNYRGKNDVTNDCKSDGSTDGFHLHSSDCTRFYRCFGGTRYNFQCPDGLLFEIGIIGCNFSNKVKCPYVKS